MCMWLVHACLLWTVLCSPVYGGGSFDECSVTASHTDVDSAKPMGRALAQRSFHTASHNVKDLRLHPQTLADSQQNPISVIKANRTSLTAAYDTESNGTLSGEYVPPKHPHESDPLQELPVPGLGEPEGHVELGEEKFAMYVLIPITTALIASLLIGNLLEKFHLAFLPESFTTLLVGVALGFYMTHYIGNTGMFTEEHALEESVGEILNLGLLPILMFDAGWGLQNKDFASQFEYIILYAIVGSLISWKVVMELTQFTGHLGFHNIKKWRTCCAFASLIAATDPVATLATYASLKVDPLLNILVFGDSTFNDAVAIVLFKIFNNDEIMGTAASNHGLNLYERINGGILWVFFGSIALGLSLGAMLLLLIRAFDMRKGQKALTIILLASAYSTFAIAEIVGLSGLICTVFCSSLLGIYARYHLSEQGNFLADSFVKQMATIMDHFVFLISGFCVVAIKAPEAYAFAWQLMIFVLIARAAGVYPMTFVANYLKRKTGRYLGKPEKDWHLISPGTCFMMWHASLRGGISLTLCLQLGDWVDADNGAGSLRTLRCATFLLICVFMVVFGGTTEFALKKMGIPIGNEDSDGKLYASEIDGSMKRRIEKFHSKVLVPLFAGNLQKHDLITRSATSWF